MIENYYLQLKLYTTIEFNIENDKQQHQIQKIFNGQKPVRTFKGCAGGCFGDVHRLSEDKDLPDQHRGQGRLYRNQIKD